MKKKPYQTASKASSKSTLQTGLSRMNATISSALQWRRASAIAMISAACLIPQMSAAQEPSQNSASLNFVAADIETVIKAIGHYTGNTFLIDPRVKGQITLVSETPLSKDQAFKLLTSTLRLQGYAVVTSDGYTKVVPEADAKLQPGSTLSDSVKGDQVATQIFRLNYESANNVVTVLRPLISPNNTINGNPGNNTVIITDYADNLKRMGKIIAALDMPSNNDLDVVPIQYAVASDIATLVSKLVDNAGPAGADAGKTTLLADSRTNSILVKAPSVARANLVKSLIAKLDQPTSQPGNVHVVYLKNAEAVKLAQTLRSILSPDSPLPTNATSSLSSGAGLNSSNPANNGIGGGSNSTFGGGSPLSTSSSSSSSSSASGSGGGFIQADPATNTLIITASESVYRNMRSIIEQLDARRAQVYVEALIVEVNANAGNDFGVQWLGLSGNSNSEYRVGGATSFTASGNNLVDLAAAASGLNNSTATGTNIPSISTGLSVGLFKQIGGKLGLGAIAHAVESSGGGNVLSIPTLITLDNEEAKIIVGQNVPFITGQFTTGSSGGGSSVNPFQTVERKDVGLSLKVRPQISDGGTVKMAIYQEVSSVDKTQSNAAGLITNKSVIESNVLVEDGQIIALGGLMKDSADDKVEEVPILGKIPLFGYLFKSQSKSKTKSNLMIFIRPVVIRTAEQSEAVSLDRYDYMKTQVNGAGENQGLSLKLEKGKLMNPASKIPSKENP